LVLPLGRWVDTEEILQCYQLLAAWGKVEEDICEARLTPSHRLFGRFVDSLSGHGTPGTRRKIAAMGDSAEIPAAQELPARVEICIGYLREA
jgi:hypothetical protein